MMIMVWERSLHAWLCKLLKDHMMLLSIKRMLFADFWNLNSGSVIYKFYPINSVFHKKAIDEGISPLHHMQLEVLCKLAAPQHAYILGLSVLLMQQAKHLLLLLGSKFTASAAAWRHPLR